MLQHTISSRTVPLSALRLDHPLYTNPRTFTGLSTKDIEEMGESTKAEGIIVPPLVQKIIDDDGEIYDLVIDGQRRVLGARDSLPKNTAIPVVDRTEEALKMTPELADELVDLALETLKREGLSSFELVEVAVKKAAAGKTLKQIEDSIGKDSSWVSKMLKARKTAGPELLTRWRKGEVTDEQFKELAQIDEGDQKAAVKEAVDLRKSGDKAEARTLVKEKLETQKAKKPTLQADPKKMVNGHNKGAVVRGPQLDLLAGKDATPIKPLGKVVLEEIFGMFDKRPPTSDYVKGVADGVKIATGRLGMESLGKAWHQYVARIEGKPKKQKKIKVPKIKAKNKVRWDAKAKKEKRGGKKASKAKAKKK